jgi:chaperonin cofactor prefoldin
VKELNKVVQNLKVEVETIKKRQREADLEMENLGKKSGITDVSITNRIQEIEERISGIEDTMKEIDTRQPATFGARGQVSARPGRLLPQVPREPSQFQDSAAGSLQVRVLTTEASSFWDRREPQSS